MKLNPSIKNMSNEYIFFTDQTALTFRICLVHSILQAMLEPQYHPDVSLISVIMMVISSHSLESERYLTAQISNQVT